MILIKLMLCNAIAYWNEFVKQYHIVHVIVMVHIQAQYFRSVLQVISFGTTGEP